jgi:hypothetical protein
MSDQLLWAVLKHLPTDYQDYGGDVKRWEDPTLPYPDCSCECKYWQPLYNNKHDSADLDWGVCLNKNGPRSGLLTWEHQAGFGCFSHKYED